MPRCTQILVDKAANRSVLLETCVWRNRQQPIIRNGDYRMKAFIKTLPVVLLGNLLMQLGIVLFVLPSGLITGGTTGIALALQHYFSMPISVFVAIFNIIMFLLGLICLGKTFAMSTLVSTFASPLMLEMLQRLVGDYVLTDDLLICALLGGLCIGASIAIIVSRGASTGGMDIPPLLLQKFMGIPVSVSLYVFDFIILLFQAPFVGRSQLLYGLLLVIVYSIVLDKVMGLGEQRYRLEIVSTKHEEIRQAILTDVDRGVTMLHGQTGYLGRETDVVVCVIAPRERHRTEQLIHRIDPHAFVILSHVVKVSGRGFSEKKRHLPQAE